MKKLLMAVAAIVAVLGAKAGVLPEGYEQLEWIETGDAYAYVNPDFTPKSTDRIYANVRSPLSIPSSGYAIFCARGAGSPAYPYTGLGIGGMFRFDYGSTGTALSWAIKANYDYRIAVNDPAGEVWINGGKQCDLPSSAPFTAGGPMTLFVWQNNMGSGTFGGRVAGQRLYSFAITNENDVAEMNLVPCRKWTSTTDCAVGVYDTVRQTFYGNASSSGALKAGPSRACGNATTYYHFNGTAGAVMRSVNYPNLTNFSACVWIRNAKAAESSSTLSVIFGQGGFTAAGFAVYINSSGELVFQTRQTNGANLSVRVPCLTANDDTWHLVGVTHDWVNKVKRIWVDGRILASVSGSSNLPDPSNSTTSQRFSLGAFRDREGAVSREYEGDMAEASLWDTVLTEEDFARLLKLRVSPSDDGLIGYWPLDEGVGTSCKDRSAGAHNMTLDNSPGAWAADASVICQKGVPDALALLDPDGGLTANHSYGLRTFSACVWVRNLLPSISSASDYFALLGEGALGDVPGWCAYFNQKANTIAFQTRDTAGTTHTISASAGFLTDGLWHAIAVTHDWEGKVMRLYVDGVLAEENAEISVDPKASSAVPFAIGMRQASSGFGRSCPGSYAHVSLWDKALTADEVKALATENPSGDEANLVGYWPLDDGPAGSFADLAGAYPVSARGGDGVGCSVDKVPFFAQQVNLSVDAGLDAFAVRAHTPGYAGEASAKVVWGPESAPDIHTNDLGTVGLPDFTGEVSHGLLPGATYRAQAFVTTDEGTLRSAVIPFVAKGVLGSSYQEVLYIESTGTQMIDTEYLPNANTFVEASLQFTGTWTPSGTNPYILGCAEGSKCFYLNFGGSDVQIGCRLNDTTVKTFDITAAIRTSRNDLFIDAAKGNVKWGTKSGSPAAKTNVHEEYTMGLFGYNNASGEMKPFSRSHMRVYSCRIYDADGLVRDFVPCRELTGQKRAGLYDRVNKKFHPNAAGTDDFLTAADETALYPLTVTSLAQDRRGPVDPDYGTLFVPAGADVPFAALADVGPENPKAKFRGWKMSAQDDRGAWQTLGEGTEKSVLFPQPASPAKFTWNWGGMGLIIVVE